MKQTDKSQSPRVTAPQFGNIPESLRNLNQWVLWKYLWRDDQGAWTKVPLQIDRQPASTTQPETWASFNSVTQAYNQNIGYFSGIGFVFTRESGIVGVDIDDCVTWDQYEDGTPRPIFDEWFLRTFNKIPGGFIEYSPSRHGVHFFVYANPKQSIKFSGGGLEIYAESRYFTVTGDLIDPVANDLIDATAPVNEIVEALLSQRESKAETRSEPATNLAQSNLPISERLQIARQSKNGAEIGKLLDGDFSSFRRADNEGRSEADMALCRYLAFYCDGNPTILRMLMEASKMVRPKWARKASADGRTYLEVLIDKVLTSEHNFFTPAKSFLNTSTAAKQPSAVSDRKNRRYRLMELGEAALKYRADPTTRGMEVGGENYYELDQVYRPLRKKMTVVVGEPGSGKTTLVVNYLLHLCMRHQLHGGFASFENDPVDLTHQLVQAFIRMPTYPEFNDCCTDAEFLQALDQIGQYFTVYDPMFEEQNVAGLSGFWEDSIGGEGLDVLYLDPFTELQPPQTLMGKYTDFVAQQLSQFQSFTRTRSLMSWLVCHPTKNFTRKEGLRLWNINGSGDFERKADYGWVVTRQGNVTQLEIQKVRHWRTGEMGAKVAWCYSQKAATYTPTAVVDNRSSGIRRRSRPKITF